jgi:hypothetical protein
MKRSLLLLSLAVLAVGTSSMAQDRERTSDGQHRVAYGIDPITGEYLFVRDMNPLLFDLSEAVPPEPSAPSGNSIQMNRVALVPWATTILSTATGFDIDGDTKREFIIRRVEDAGASSGGRFEFYESVTDNSFALAHVLDLGNDVNPGVLVAYYPGDVGDADGDGLSELAVFGRTQNDFYVRLYESLSTDDYPSELVWEIGGAIAEGYFWQMGVKI